MSGSALVLAAALVLADAPADPGPAARQRSTRLVLAGSMSVLVSGGLWAVMVRALAAGARDARRYDELVAAANSWPRPLTADERAAADLRLAFGRQDNRVAIAGGVAAGLLVTLGAALLGRGLVLRRRVARVDPLGVPRGGGVALTLSF